MGNYRNAKNVKPKKKRDWTFWFTLIVIVVFIIVVACVYFVKKYNATEKTAITVGEYEVTQVELDFYYNMMVNNYVSTYSDYLTYFGLDTDEPYDEQTYLFDSSLTWYDYFLQSAVEWLQEVKALTDDAEANDFEYDVTEDYEDYLETIDYYIESAGVSESYYYKISFGDYATKDRLENIVKEYLLYMAYYDELEETLVPTEEDVQAAYDAAPDQYDGIDYYLYAIVAVYDEEEDDEDTDTGDETSAEDETSADEEEEEEEYEPTEEEIEAAVDEAEEKAYEMVERWQAGEDWRELCYEYAIDSAKDAYDPDEEEDPTYNEGSTSLTISSDYFDWLNDDERESGDVLVYRDDDDEAVFIVIFDGKEAYDLDEDEDGIEETLAETMLSDYIEALVENYEVVDVSNCLTYLQTDEDETSEETEEETETEETEEET